jgi:transcriptional regulator with XRE-family HTH domain
MPESSIPTVAELVNRLFATHRKENGQEYTNQEIAQRMNYEMSPSSIGKIRNGIVPNPGRTALLLLCRAFDVPAAYFFPELENQEEQNEAQLKVALRNSGLNTEAQLYLEGLIEALRKDRHG